MASIGVPVTKTSARPTFSCNRCAERKVKCDRQRPRCSACSKHNVDCKFTASKPTQKKQKRIKVQELTGRLKRYEDLLTRNGIVLSEDPNEDLPRRPSHLAALHEERGQMGPQPTEQGRDIPDTSLPSHGHENLKFVENSLWRRVFEEVSVKSKVFFTQIEASSSDIDRVTQSNDSEIMVDYSESSSESESAVDEHKFVFGVQPRRRSGPSLPSIDIMQQLWLTFVENFDPLTKIVHVPTLRPAFEKALSDTSQIPRNFETLMFAIFGAAVMTLKDNECQRIFNETQRNMLSRFTTATEAALSRAKFMATTSLVVLQALVIHLFSVRDLYEPRTVYTLTGIAVRIAHGIGIDRDGITLGYSAFDTEIRRRVWWQLKSHDFRAAELCGLAKFRTLEPTSAESTKYPSNISDEDLHPSMVSLESKSRGLTDASFVAFKFEMTEFAAARIARFRHLGKDPSQWNLDAPDLDKAVIKTEISVLEDKLEKKYLRYCDPSQPLHLVLLLVGRYVSKLPGTARSFKLFEASPALLPLVIISLRYTRHSANFNPNTQGMKVVNFLTHHPRRWASMDNVPLSEREFVWDCSVKLLEQYNMMLSNTFLERFAWHAPYFQQWQAFIYVLDTLRAEPLATTAPQTWNIVGSIFENTPNLISDMRKPIHVAICNLCLKAYDARENTLLSSGASSSSTPAFITRLRQQREMTIAKQQTRKDHRRAGHNSHTSRLGQVPQPVGPNETPTIRVSSHTMDTNRLNFNQAFGVAENDSLRYFGFLDDNNLATNDPQDFDFTLPEEYQMENTMSYEAIDWEQWDSWLAESNLIASSSR
ncbi:hypothetical protein DE146DRAFT_763878 [Phaeosphaeria sp. MPI-PUGE-AT-0046c]|nr:hypothetical protein DE146DRAFT_763878 [Phaeosphaeria sp. MPI-PUGE-AT-0046c]